MSQTILPKGAAPMDLRREIGKAGIDRLLTIVIASYNHRRYLADAFAAIEMSGVCQRISLLFIDDGSPDDTMSFVEAYPFVPDLHVRILAKKNAGLRDSLASGLAMADTRFVAFIASDDMYVPEGLATVIARLDEVKSDDICWICQATYLEGRDGEAVYRSSLEAVLSAAPDRRERALSIEFPKPLLLQSTVFGTEMLREAGAWADGLALDDWPTFVKVARLARNRDVIMRAMFDVVLCRYRLHDSGSHNNLGRQLAICLETAERGVASQYRREAMANVLMDVALIHLYQREMGPAVRLFSRAVVAYPHPNTVARPFVRIISSAIRRMTGDGTR